MKFKCVALVGATLVLAALLAACGSAEPAPPGSPASPDSPSGRYTLQFRSPRLSHIARTPDEQATSFEELREISIPCEPVSLTIGE